MKNGREFRRLVGQLVKDEVLKVPSSSTSSEDEETKLLVCQASGHQGEGTPYLYHYPGQQCGAIAVAALLYSTILPVDSWQQSDLDKLLKVGDRLHFFQVCCLRFQIGSTQKLTVDELPTKVTAFTYEFHIKSEVLAGTTSKDESVSGMPVLEDILRECVASNSFGLVLRYQDYCVSCINSYGEWFLFDSHARDSKGMVNGKGSAILLKFPNSAAVNSHIRAFRGNDSSFEALLFRNIQRKSTAHKDEMRVYIVPAVVLVTYTSQYGNVQLYSDSLQNLEHGYLIDDNLMDFVLFYKAQEESEKSRVTSDTLYIFSSCFYKGLTHFNPNRIRNWTKRVNIFNKDFLIIPVCTGCHWLLVVLKMNQGAGISMVLFDSANRLQQSSSQIHRPSVERLIKNYLKDEWAATGKHEVKTRSVWFEDVCYADVPQQPNETDCGVYVIKVFAEFLNDLPMSQWPHWTPRFSHDAVLELRNETMFLLQDLASKQGL